MVCEFDDLPGLHIYVITTVEIKVFIKLYFNSV